MEKIRIEKRGWNGLSPALVVDDGVTLRDLISWQNSRGLHLSDLFLIIFDEIRLGSPDGKKLSQLEVTHDPVSKSFFSRIVKGEIVDNFNLDTPLFTAPKTAS